MLTLRSITVPDNLQRNSPDVLAAGVEETGELLLTELAQRMGRKDLDGLDLLDLGCGVRFTQTLINRNLPFVSYTGVEVSRLIINWLSEHVEKNDDRFHFVHWNVHNPRYNPQAPSMTNETSFPVSGEYDVIMGFSLVTHLAPADAAHLFRLARNVVRSSGRLFFSAFCDSQVEKFEDRIPERPLLQAYYNQRYLEDLLGETGWTLLSHEEPHGYIMDSFLCRPS